MYLPEAVCKLNTPLSFEVVPVINFPLVSFKITFAKGITATLSLIFPEHL